MGGGGGEVQREVVKLKTISLNILFAVVIGETVVLTFALYKYGNKIIIIITSKINFKKGDYSILLAVITFLFRIF